MASQKDGIVLYHASLDLEPADAELFRDAVSDIPDVLRMIGVGQTVEIESFPDELLGALVSENTVDPLLEVAFAPPLTHKFVLGIPEEHAIADAAKKSHSAAEWGMSLGGCAALTYKPGIRHLVWHEILHLLGADDCYELPDEGPTCEEKKCIMQWVANEENCGSGLVLCEGNIGLIKEHLGRLLFA